jgi:hypothetical protein
MRHRVLFSAVALAAVAAPLFGAQTLSAHHPAPAPNSGAVRTWNAHAVEALTNAATAPVPGAGQTPPVSAIHLAMVQTAVYDAVNSIGGRYEPYLDDLPPAAEGASVDAAVATAAHHVLVGLGIPPVPPLPDLVLARLEQLYTDALGAIPDGPAEEGGIAAGAAAAAAMLAERTGDGRYVPTAFTTGTGPGEWRPTPPANVNDPFAWVANVRPFVLESASQVRTRGPLDLRSRAYAREYKEVKTTGAVDSPRTPEQQAVAEFFSANPVPLYNRTFRDIAVAESLSLREEARLFAMISVAAADGLIGCWDDKEHYGYWRPITAIHNGDADGNRRTVGDTAWTPMMTTPPYPDHPSGYNCITGAVMHTGKRFFGANRMDFALVQTTPAGDVIREYRRFTDVIDDTIDARVWLGIHFRTADVQGARLGKEVARWLDRHYFERVH